MADEIKVNPTPNQRNLQDVAIELTQLYYRDRVVGEVGNIQETYLKFFSIASHAFNSSDERLDAYLPDSIKNPVD